MTVEPTITSGVTRRSALVAGIGAVGVAALAACSSDSDPTTSSAAPTTEAPATTGPAGSAPATAGGTATPSTSAAAVKGLVALDSIKVGEAVSAELPDGSKIVVARPTSSTAAAFSAKCTHQGCTVQPAGKELDCPCHGSKFNAVTGAVINGPASEPLPKVDVRVTGGQVVASG